MRRVNYRNIWEEHNQMEIPRDEDGRSYEIHHIDGNRDNNHPDNLLLVSIEQHFKIHYEQGDWGAAFMIAKRMVESFEDIKKLNSLHNQSRVENGTHPLMSQNRDEEFEKKRYERMMESLAKMIEAGEHHFQDSAFQTGMSKRAIASVKHPSKTGLLAEEGRKISKKQMEDGTHNFLTNHPNKVRYVCEVTGEVNIKASFTKQAKKLGLEKWPHKLTKTY